ncbi:MAG: 3'-5' exonuclease, partial [Leptospiraceae bacterium]|nr:3'-5' exonuclease [Leptospiraceae bacterium]
MGVLDTITWVAVDTETTGINPFRHELVEIGAVRFTLQGGISERFQVLIRPKHKFDPKARAVNLITPEEIAKYAIELEEALPAFFAFLRNDLLLFHNAPFDLAFIARSAQKIRIPLPRNKYYDHLYFSRTHFPDRPSHSLRQLKQQLNIDTGQAHRALADAEATALIFLDALHKRAGEITSKKKFARLMGKARRVSNFEIRLPENLDEILKYFSRAIKARQLLKINYRQKTGEPVTATVRVLDFLILNQRLFLKALPYPPKEPTIIPLQDAIIYDPDRGPIQFLSQRH